MILNRKDKDTDKIDNNKIGLLREEKKKKERKKKGRRV